MTIQYGFDYFIPIGENNFKDSTFSSTNGSLNQIDRHSSEGVIKMFKKGEQPQLAYEAKIVLNNFQEEPLIKPEESIPKTNIQSPDTNDKQIQFGFGLGAILQSKGDVDIDFDMSLNDSQYLYLLWADTESKYKFDSSLTLNLFVRSLREREIGFIVGLDYILPQKEKEMDIQLSTILPKASIAIQFNPIYFFGGLNYSFPIVKNNLELSDFSSPPAITALKYKYDINGGLGYQIGIGFLISKNLSLELEHQWIRFDQSLSVNYNVNNLQINEKYESMIKNIILGLKYSFN